MEPTEMKECEKALDGNKMCRWAWGQALCHTFKRKGKLLGIRQQKKGNAGGKTEIKFLRVLENIKQDGCVGKKVEP